MEQNERAPALVLLLICMGWVRLYLGSYS